MDAEKEKRFRFQMQYEQEQQAQPQQEAPREMGGSPPLGFVASKVYQMAPWNKANQVLKEDVAGGIAEAGGYLGGVAERKGYPNLGKFVQAEGVGVAGAIGLAPEILAAYSGLKGIYNSPNPTVKGLVNTPEELSPQYTAQNKAIGLNSRPPEQAGGLKFQNPYNQTLATKTPPALQTETSLASNLRSAEALPETTPLKYPKDPATLINTMDQRATQFGEKLNQQELYDYKRLLDQNIGDPNKIPKYIDGKKNPLYAQASGLRSRISDILNRIIEPKLANADLPEGTIPDRAGLDKAYGVASKVQQGTKKALKYAGGIAGVAALERYIRSKVGR